MTGGASRLGRAARSLGSVVESLAWVLAGLVVVQAVLAGHLLSGNGSARHLHELVATNAIMWAAALQVLASALWWRPGGGPGWAPATAVALFATLLFQLGWGYHGRLALHVPVGVSMLGAQIVMAVLVRRFWHGRGR